MASLQCIRLQSLRLSHSKGGMDDRIFAIANIHPRFFQQHRLEGLVQLKTRPGKGCQGVVCGEMRPVAYSLQHRGSNTRSPTGNGFLLQYETL